MLVLLPLPLDTSPHPVYLVLGKEPKLSACSTPEELQKGEWSELAGFWALRNAFSPCPTKLEGPEA